MASEEHHLSWQIVSVAEAIERVVSAGYPRLPDQNHLEAALPDIGILYFYGHDPPPRIVTWIQPRDATALQRMRRQAIASNDFGTWLAKNHPAEIWQLATAWTFHEQWLWYAHHPNWLVMLRKRFPSDNLIDQILAQSRGWIVWRFQLEAVMFAAIADLTRVQELAKSWVLHRPDAPALLDGIRLPNGASLLSVLNERSMRATDGSVFVRGRPNMYTVARIHCLYTEHFT